MSSVCVGTSSIHKKGLFATRDIQKGEALFTVDGPVIRYTFEPNYRLGANWMQIRENVWKIPLRGGLWNYINHSCEPNAWVRHPYAVVAMRPMVQGEEVTIDYSLTEGGWSWRMACACGSSRCRGTIRSIQHLPHAIVHAYEPYISPFLKRINSRGKTYFTNDGQRKLFARHPLKKGEIVCTVEGPVVAYTFPPDYRVGYQWLAVGKNRWVVPLRKNPWSHIRHSCEPNVGLNDRRQLVAMRAVLPDEELVIDDAMTEADPRWRRTCRCGAASCRGTVRSVQFLEPSLFRRYRPFLSSFIQRSYEAGRVRI